MITKYMKPNTNKAIKSFLLAFQDFYIVENGFSQAYAMLIKQRNRLSLEMRGDLRVKLTSFIEFNFLASTNELNQLNKRYTFFNVFIHAYIIEDPA